MNHPLPILLVAALAGPPVPADPVPDSATPLVALFMRSCVSFAGDATSLRQWVARTNLPEVPADHTDEFLNGLPGAAYDASGGTLALVLISQDDGSCSVIADSARGADVVTSLDATLRAANIAFTTADDAPDAQTKDLNNRDTPPHGSSGAGTCWSAR